MSDTSPIIRCQNVWKLYGPGAEALSGQSASRLDDAFLAARGLVPAVRDVTLDIRQGEIFVIMGLSGSGKSTLVRCMTGLVDTTLGDLWIGADNLRGIEAKRLVDIRRRRISMVFQDFALLPHLTVLDNIAFPLRVQGMGREARLKRARELAELVALTGREDRFPHELSGGQQQRVGIARSLTTDPEIWFLDEPFSALDPLIRHEMQDEFLRLQGTLHKTIVFITHDFEEAIRIADRIAIMHDGRVVQVDTPEGLILNPADAYVAEFTRKIPRHRVMRAGSLTRPAPAQTEGTPVPATALVADIAARVLASDRPVPVADEKGAIIGAVDRDRVIAAICGTDAA
ncbi:MAG: ATP-binding cassette domain-containing protein [Proteobacteria bacterium]|nr:ATP-binding cassette domain-containing protein [Pseudomonadota bacterium]MBS0574344.1 ATP-binding cassette domain-containing protein [Pseudomonadota bacterium]